MLGKVLYDGKAKQLFAGIDDSTLIIKYKDSFTAFNGEKKAEMEGKGLLNSKINNIIFAMLKENGVPTHVVKEIDETTLLVKKVSIIPLEVIIRNVAAGSFSKHYGVDEGVKLLSPVLEFSYKNDSLGDPLINDYHIIALGIATKIELDVIASLSFRINELLKEFFLKAGIKLIDFKIEFGKLSDGTIILADEISPDSCRLWDDKTNAKLDKDRFRRDMGNVLESYNEVLRRISK